MAAPDLSRLASPSDHPQSLIGDFDYPAIAKAARQEGRVGFKVFVGTSGKVTSCHIASSSGHPLLDQATCDALKEKMRFVIALNEEGHPVEGEYKDEVIWQLEK